MRFLLPKEDRSTTGSNNPEAAMLNASTSVNGLKDELFALLSELGELQEIPDGPPTEVFKRTCAEDGVVVAAVHGDPPDETPCRLLRHSLGSLMVPGGFLGGWEFRDATTNVVTSTRQVQQLQRGLGRACPHLGILIPGMNTSLFHLPEQRRQAPEQEFRLLYAGRFIANKGIAQTVRALNLWPITGARLTLVGAFEPDFFLYHSNATHSTFPSFFAREVLGRSPHMPIAVQDALPRSALAQAYAEADCFVYPSFHEDENFGMAPREAILCGTPAVVSDLCGLGQLQACSGGTLRTYPSLAGVRYSLHELRQRLAAVAVRSAAEREAHAAADAALVLAECDRAKARASLRTAVHDLLQRPVGPAPTGGWRSKDRWDRLVQLGPPSLAHAEQQKSAPIPEGLYVDGTGFPSEGRWFSDAHFMQAIQGLYTTYARPPETVIGAHYRGFWRVGLWAEERALVEFGFPGMRAYRFGTADWRSLCSTASPEAGGEPVFKPTTPQQCRMLQPLIDLGYLVPDIL